MNHCPPLPCPFAEFIFDQGNTLWSAGKKEDKR